VQRLPDYTGCGCCHEFEGPEEGVVGFRAIGERGGEGEDEDGEEGEVEDDVEGEEVDEEDEDLVGSRKRTTMSEDAMEVFLTIREKDPGYSIPTLKEMDLTRDGVLI
jgi:hypothetical protein